MAAPSLFSAFSFQPANCELRITPPTVFASTEHIVNQLLIVRLHQVYSNIPGIYIYYFCTNVHQVRRIFRLLAVQTEPRAIDFDTVVHWPATLERTHAWGGNSRKIPRRVSPKLRGVGRHKRTKMASLARFRPRYFHRTSLGVCWHPPLTLSVTSA